MDPIAKTQRAIVALGSGAAGLVRDRPMPKLRDEYILVKTKAVALNPSDWKHIKYLVHKPGPLVGCDYAGIVEEVGSKAARDFQKGDEVCGVAHGSNAVQHEDGTFAEYIVVKAAVQIRIPRNMSFEEASTLGAGITTVGQGLYQTLGLALPTNPIKEPLPILIYGGSTATSALGIQFARLSGYTVITTCSPRNLDQVKAMGADAKEDVSCSFTLAYTGLGEAFTFGDTPVAAQPHDLEHASQFWDLAKELLESEKIKVRKPRVQQGLEKVLDGLKELENNSVSNEKLVYFV